MNETQTMPTDAEIIALADETRTGEPGRGGYILPISFARAVLAKWGQPAHSGAPVAWLDPWRADQVTTDYDAYGEHGIPLYTTPQPSPAAQEDAARYRFLRDGEWRDTDLEPFIRLQLNTLWDAKIDAARAAQEGKK